MEKREWCFESSDLDLDLDLDLDCIRVIVSFIPGQSCLGGF